MLVRYLFVLSCALAWSVFFIFLLGRFFARQKALAPKGIPVTGGIAMGAAFILSCALGFIFIQDFPSTAKAIVISSAVMLVFGILDDYKELSIAVKFLVQFISISVLISLGVRTQIAGIGNLANIVITFIWVLGITNAFNHLDVIDGLAGGAAFSASLAFLAISILNADASAAILSISLAAAVFGFLIYNFPPAKIYMGNSGSHFLGFVLAAVALTISYAPLERRIALFSPLLILGLPILDTGFLILIRLFKKKLPFKKSDDHIALKLLSLGFSKKSALMFMLWVGAFFSICGILVSKLLVVYCVAIITLAVAVSLILLIKMCQLSLSPFPPPCGEGEGGGINAKH